MNLSIVVDTLWIHYQEHSGTVFEKVLFVATTLIAWLLFQYTVRCDKFIKEIWSISLIMTFWPLHTWTTDRQDVCNGMCRRNKMSCIETHRMRRQTRMSIPIMISASHFCCMSLFCSRTDFFTSLSPSLSNDLPFTICLTPDSSFHHVKYYR